MTVMGFIYPFLALGKGKWSFRYTINKKANIALRYLSLMRGKSDISQKWTETLKEHLDDKEFKFGIIW